MQRLELERPTLERFYQEDYDALIVDLEGLGWTLVERPRDEYRAWLPGLEVGALWVAFRLLDKVADSGLDDLVEAIRKRLRRVRDTRQPPRRCVIFGPNGERLREIELDAHDDVVFVFGRHCRVTLSHDDAEWLTTSWYTREGGLAGARLQGAIKRALETGDPVMMTEPMRIVLRDITDAIEAAGRLTTEGLRALWEEARKPI